MLYSEPIHLIFSAPTYFGARHGLETLSQLITFDVENSLEEDLHISSLVSIKDEPVYPYRGLLLDTSRNYYSIESIKVRLPVSGITQNSPY